MKKLALLAVLLTLAPRAFAAGAGCSNTAGPLTLEKVRAGASGTEMFGCINRSLDVLSSSAVYSGTGSTATFKLLRVGQITGLSGGGGVWVSSNVTVTSSMTLTGDIWLGGTIRSSVTMADTMSALTGSFGSSAVRPLPLAVMVTSTYGFSAGNLLREVRIGQYPGTDEPAIQGFKNNDQSNIVLNLNPAGGSVVVGGLGLYSSTNIFQSNGAAALNSSMLVGGPSSFSGSLTARSSMTISGVGGLLVSGAGGITSTYGVSAATGTFGGGICPSTASVCLNALPLAANAGAYFGGSVGVGTTSPGNTKLVVQAVQNAPSAVSTGSFKIAHEDGYADITFGALPYSPYSGWMQVSQSGAGTDTQTFLLNPMGGGVKVGGTGLPVQALDVAGSVSLTGVVTASGTGTNYFGGNIGVSTNTPTVGAGGSGTVVKLYSPAAGAQASEFSLAAGVTGNGQWHGGLNFISGSPDNVRSAVIGGVNEGVNTATANGKIVFYTASAGSLTEKVSINKSGGLGLYSRTAAQLKAITPTAAGQIYYCSDCSNAVHVVVSTGSAVCQFDAFTGGTAWH